MKIHRELKLVGPADNRDNLIRCIEKSLKDGWIRDREKEALLKGSMVDLIIFTCTQSGSRSAASLFFATDEEKSQLRLSNMNGPGPDLDIGQERSLLDEFQSKFLDPVAEDLGVRVISTPDERTIDNSMSPEMVELLKRFSNRSNKSSGGTEHGDRDCFFDFIAQAHKESSLLNESVLNELLVEDGWPAEYAYELSCSYRFGRDLLKHMN
jgi:hypothetical protein